MSGNVFFEFFYLTPYYLRKLNSLFSLASKNARLSARADSNWILRIMWFCLLPLRVARRVARRIKRFIWALPVAVKRKATRVNSRGRVAQYDNMGPERDRLSDERGQEMARDEKLQPDLVPRFEPGEGKKRFPGVRTR